MVIFIFNIFAMIHHYQEFNFKLWEYSTTTMIYFSFELNNEISELEKERFLIKKILAIMCNINCFYQNISIIITHNTIY